MNSVGEKDELMRDRLRDGRCMHCGTVNAECDCLPWEAGVSTECEDCMEAAMELSDVREENQHQEAIIANQAMDLGHAHRLNDNLRQEVARLKAARILEKAQYEELLRRTDKHLDEQAMTIRGMMSTLKETT